MTSRDPSEKPLRDPIFWVVIVILIALLGWGIFQIYEAFNGR